MNTNIKTLTFVTIVAWMLTFTPASFSDQSAGQDREQRWWPSSWGQEDQMGALNHLTPSKTIQAAQLITRGIVFDMAHTIAPDMPSFHSYKMTLTGGETRTPLGSNRSVYNGEYFSGPISAIGTQFDALGHAGRALGRDGDGENIRYYNGFKHSDIKSINGFTKLSIDQIKPFFTRGILVDLASYRGRTLEAGELITSEDLEGALKAQGMSTNSIAPGDAFFFYTGFSKYWDTEKYGNKYLLGTPGLSAAAANLLADRGVISVGSDQPALEPNKRESTERLSTSDKKVGPIHEIFLVNRGVYIFENLVLKELAAEKAYYFAFAFGPIPFKGATTSTARPFAIF